MKRDPKTSYAQSSDIKSRTYLEYRRDMKRKAIAELEARELSFYDFKVSKVAKKIGNRRCPIKNKLFVYIHKPLLKYAIFKPDWIVKNGRYGMVEAWRSYAFRVPAERFEKILKSDKTLASLCKLIDTKNFILEFQHNLLTITRQRLSHILQAVVDKERLLRIAPRDLESFFRICFILDHMGEVPENAALWIVYLISFIGPENTLEEIFKITYCLDFLYSKVDLKANELKEVVKAIRTLIDRIQQCAKDDGSYSSCKDLSPIDETRYALFVINLLEDMIQDAIFYYSARLEPIRKIYQTIPDVEKTYEFIVGAE